MVLIGGLIGGLVQGGLEVGGLGWAHLNGVPLVLAAKWPYRHGARWASRAPGVSGGSRKGGATGRLDSWRREKWSEARYRVGARARGKRHESAESERGEKEKRKRDGKKGPQDPISFQFPSTPARPNLFFPLKIGRHVPALHSFLVLHFLHFDFFYFFYSVLRSLLFCLC